jgi:hypothetical protein
MNCAPNPNADESQVTNHKRSESEGPKPRVLQAPRPESGKSRQEVSKAASGRRLA